MQRTKPEETKLVICVWHPFTEWRPKPLMAEAIRKRWSEMRVVHLPDYDKLLEDLWDKPQHLTELSGQVLLIVGYGSIGREVAKRAKAFEMRVFGVTRSGEGDRSFAEKIFAAAKLQEALPEADYVVISAPETAETRHLIGAAEIAKMKRGARLINIGRGSLLDEEALIRALRDGALGGAALDVAQAEPLPAESPLWHAPNLLITPHTSGVSDRLWHRQTALLMELLERWFDRRELFNRVDFARGY